MNWTTEFPTKPGWYWVKNLSFWIDAGGWAKPDPDPQIVRFVAPTVPPDAAPHLTFSGWDVSQSISRIHSAEWYGPLEPPG